MHRAHDAGTDGGVSASATRPTRTNVPPSGADDAPRVEEHLDVNALIRRVQEGGDRIALTELMAAFDWLVVSCAHRMRRRGEAVEDLEQVAREALLGAVSRFDLERGIAFRTFAWATTMGVLRHHYRSGWQVRVPRGLQELHLAATRGVEELTNRHGVAPTVDQLASHLDADREDVLLALDAGHAYRAGSLDEAWNDHDGDIVRHEGALATVDEAVDNTADRVQVRELLAALPPRQRTILVMQYFEGRTQFEIGESLGISQVHVSRLSRAALASLRTPANIVG